MAIIKIQKLDAGDYLVEIGFSQIVDKVTLENSREFGGMFDLTIHDDINKIFDSDGQKILVGNVNNFRLFDNFLEVLIKWYSMERASE